MTPAGMDGRYKGGGGWGERSICKPNDPHNPPLPIINYYQHNCCFRKNTESEKPRSQKSKKPESPEAKKPTIQKQARSQKPKQPTERRQKSDEHDGK